MGLGSDKMVLALPGTSLGGCTLASMSVKLEVMSASEIVRNK